MHTAEEVRAAASEILDIFTAIDGGVQFATFWHGTLDSIIKDIDNPDAQRICDIIIAFKRLVSIGANK
jgi:hypothetical protein